MTARGLLRRARFASERDDVMAFKSAVISLVNELSRYAQHEETAIDTASMEQFEDEHLRVDTDPEIGGIQFRNNVCNKEERHTILTDLQELVAKAPA